MSALIGWETGVATFAAPAEDDPPPAPAAAPVVTLSPAAAEILHLAQAGVGTDVLLAYINNSPSRYELAADHLIYLNDVGVPGSVSAAMIQHDLALKGATPAPTESSALPPLRFVAPDPATTAAPTPDEVVPPDAPAPPPPPVEAATGDPALADYQLPPTPDLLDPAAALESTPYFYDSLAPYGTWIFQEGFGWCWQPTVETVDANWQPYCDRGRWLDTDAGWYWYSDYSWGWAVFHYGRWWHHPHRGWLWQPGRTWAPAWVSWRRGTDYCGWAPLPPWARFVAGVGFLHGHRLVGEGFEFGLAARHYTFIPTARMLDYTPGRYRTGRMMSNREYATSSVVNHYPMSAARVHNPGVDPAWVAQAAHSERHPVAVHEGATPVHGERWEKLDKADGHMMIQRPPLPTGGHSPTTPGGHPPAGHPAPAAPAAPAGGGRHAAAPAEPATPAAPRPFPNMNLAGQARAATPAPAVPATGPGLPAGSAGWQGFRNPPGSVPVFSFAGEPAHHEPAAAGPGWQPAPRMPLAPNEPAGGVPVHDGTRAAGLPTGHPTAFSPPPAPVQHRPEPVSPQPSPAHMEPHVPHPAPVAPPVPPPAPAKGK